MVIGLRFNNQACFFDVSGNVGYKGNGYVQMEPVLPSLTSRK
jgi:hypothetical protein